MNGSGGIESCEVLAGTEISALDGYAGGIVGRMTGGYIKNCTSHANISGAETIGGIVGRITSTVNRSKITGNTFNGADREVGSGTGYFDPDSTPNPEQEQDPTYDSNTTHQDEQTSSGGGGGCNLGCNFFILAAVALFSFRKH